MLWMLCSARLLYFSTKYWMQVWQRPGGGSLEAALHHSTTTCILELVIAIGRTLSFASIRMSTLGFDLGYE